MIPVSLDRCIAIILRRRWLVVAVATLLMLAVAGGARFIGVTNDYRSLFDEDNPQLAAFDDLENTYSVSHTALIAVAPREGSVFTVNTAMGFAGWTGTVFNPANSGVPIIIMTIAVADSIHIITATLACCAPMSIP